jgi:site-specific recombinase XerD
MSAHVTLQARVAQYLAERRHAGFDLTTMGHGLERFVRYVDQIGHDGPLTVNLMAAWAAQAKGGRGDRATFARQLRLLRPFAGWLRQFEPNTEVPDEAIFGPVPGRTAPHIYREHEIVELLAAARGLGHSGRVLDSLRSAVIETLFGLIACTGLRISEALGLYDADVNLQAQVLTIRQSKFGKSRLVPLHPSAVHALARYRTQRNLYVRARPQAPFFVSTRGKLLGQPVGDRQIHRIFEQLRKQLGWVDRGTHGAPRVHDLRHAFAVRRLILWHEEGVDIDQRMLALSTYLGHAKVSNTYWYLSGVPELMSLIGLRFEKFADPWEDCDE